MKSIEHRPYPAAERGTATDNYFGTEVPDPYRWLEDDASEATAAWVAAENAVTEDYLSRIPFREAIRRRLAELWDYPKKGIPERHGRFDYCFCNDGLQNQPVLLRKPVEGGVAEVFLDPNTLSAQGTVALGTVRFSEDDAYCAYTLSESGSDWAEIRVLRTADKTPTDDRIEWVKFSGASWAGDSRGFYYSAYDAPQTAGRYSARNRHQKICYHALGTPQSADRLVYEDKEHPLRYFSAWEKGGWLFVVASEGTSGNEILCRRVSEPDAPLRVLLAGFDADFEPVDCRDGFLYYLTDRDAANRTLRRIAPDDPAHDEVVIAQKDRPLESVAAVGGYLIATYLEEVRSRVFQYDSTGRPVREIALPGRGTVSGFAGKDAAAEVWYSYTDFLTPPVNCRYTLATGESEADETPPLRFDPSLYTTEQVFYPSKDGTLVPMFVSHRRDLVRDGSNLCYLYGYGGFGISLTPNFNPSALLLMEQGAVYCVANLRGGAEYGERWHKAGMLGDKQRVFDDFIAAAEWLVAQGYTSPAKLAIAGGSNGGLLVGACVAQRPDLFAVCLPAVGVMDMLRYHRFTVGWGWAVEYGTSECEEQFGWLYAYSPLHNLREGVAYPATLLTTADRDDRVVPAHSFKFAARMQHCQGGRAPVLIRIERDAGHGAGKPTAKRIAETADVYSFLFQNTGTPYDPDRSDAPPERSDTPPGVPSRTLRCEDSRTDRTRACGRNSGPRRPAPKNGETITDTIQRSEL